MKIFDRRGFMKSCLATAASASPLYGRSYRALNSLPKVAEPSLFTSLENGDQQLRASTDGATFGFQNFVRVQNEWRAATLPQLPLITGPSFPLKASRLSRKDSTLVCEGSATAEGPDGKSFSYNWNAEISAHSQEKDLTWFRFRTALNLPRPIRLQQGTQVEPQVIVWLNSNSTLMEGQSGSWRR